MERLRLFWVMVIALTGMAQGPMSCGANRVSAEQANLAAYAVLSKALLPGMACEHFKTILKGSMPRAIAGARVKADCDPRLVPVEVARKEP